MRLSIRALLASVLVCGLGLADPIERGDFRLVWKTPAACPTDLEVLARIEALLGSRVSEMKLAPLAARGRVTALGPAHFELALETFQGEQRFLRTMQAGTCEELADAGALVLALAIDPTLSERRATAAHGVAPPGTTPGGDPAGASSATAPHEAAPRGRREPSGPARRRSVATPPPRPEPPSPERSPRFLVGARAVVDFGSVADVAVGPGLGVGVRWGALEASLEGLWLPTRRTLAEPGKGGDISLAATSVRGCYRPISGTIEAFGCGVFELGSLDGEGVGTIVRTHRSGLWAAPGVAAGGRVRLGSRFLLSLGGGALVPIQPIDFTLDNVGLVRRVPPLVGRVEAGVSAHFD